MLARHAFACVLVTALIAVTAALLHPLLGLGLGLGPLHGVQGLEGLQGQASPAKMGSTGDRRTSLTRSQ